MNTDRPNQIGLEDSVAGATLPTMIPPATIRPDERDDPSVPSVNSRSTPPPGLIQIPGYTFIELLQKPDRNIVYRAKEDNSDQDVVVKQFTPEELEQFTRQKDIENRLPRDHPNLLLADRFLAEYRSIISRHLRGGDFHHLMDRVGMLHPSQTKVIALNLLDALHVMHTRGIIYRDVKSRNILLDIINPDVENITAETLESFLDFRLKLCDYELAGHPSLSDESKEGKRIGTPRYMAPEACKGEKNDPRSDLYSVGVLFYRALAGVYPIDGENHEEIMARQISDSFPDITELNTEITPGQKAVLEKLWAKDPKKRYQMARDFQYDWLSELC